MSTVHLIHGFNVSDGGQGSVGTFAPTLRQLGFSAKLHDYGWVGPIRLRLRNSEVVQALMDDIGPEDHILAHSNGCLIAWELLRAGLACRSVIAIQPALRRDTLWPIGVERVLCLYNDEDVAVLGARLWRYINPVSWFNPHQWGMAGREGFSVPDPRLEQWDTLDPKHLLPVGGHSSVFRPPYRGYWAAQVGQWLWQLQKTPRGVCAA